MLRAFSTNDSFMTTEISHVITKTWTRVEFAERITSLGIDVKPLFKVPMKLADYKVRIVQGELHLFYHRIVFIYITNHSI